MPKCNTIFPVPLPDDPNKWEGWSNYKSSNFYERLCLDPHANPSNELIEERCLVRAQPADRQLLG